MLTLSPMLRECMECGLYDRPCRIGFSLAQRPVLRDTLKLSLRPAYHNLDDSSAVERRYV
jgi:hypothetical protein